ncbi:TPA: hypothetical protein I8625_001743, partial [Serratia marcescens]|nr:hypothetical protein [Serratia marcescens]
NFGVANEFRKSLVEQIERILLESDVTLGVPIESRVKDHDSLLEKLERKEITIKKIADLDDLVGLRVK